MPRPHPAHARRRGSGVASPNPWASSRNVESGIETTVQLVWSPHGTHMESGMKLKKHGATNEIAEQSGIYWNNAEARTSTSPLKASGL